MRISAYLMAISVVTLAACGQKKAIEPSANEAAGVPVTGTASPSPEGEPEAEAAPAAEVAKADEPKADEPKADEPVAKADEPAADEAKAEPTFEGPLTMERLEELANAVGSCELTSDDIDPRCPALVELQLAVRADPRKLAELREPIAALSKKLLQSESPAHRIQALRFLQPTLNTAATLETLRRTFKKEKEREVRLALLNLMAPGVSRDEGIRRFVESALGDEDMLVRGHAIRVLTVPNNKKLKGLAERIIEVANNDKEKRVRAVACEYAGRLGDEAIIPSMTKLVAADADPELQQSCLRGLISMWADAPSFDNASDKAYALTLELLQRKPRNRINPSWVAIRDLAAIGVVTRKRLKDPKREGWRNRVRHWYNPMRLRQILEDIVTDEAASDRAVSEALKTLVALGAGRDQIALLQMRLKDSPRMRPDGEVPKAFEELTQAKAVKRLDMRAPAPKKSP